jgi:hypothetical protein
MNKLRQVCTDNGWALVYHYTQPMFGKMIAKTGFRMSTQGQGDGGVYFSTKGPASYGLGTPEYETNIIIDCFGESRLDEYRGKHKLDMLIVYGAHPQTLSPAPGGRNNAVMVRKSDFELLSRPTPEGNYFLRPDRILAVFQFDSSRRLKGLNEEVKLQFEKEEEEDAATRDWLRSLNGIIHENEVGLLKLQNEFMDRISTIRSHSNASSSFGLNYNDDNDDDDDDDNNNDNVVGADDRTANGLGDEMSSSNPIISPRKSSIVDVFGWVLKPTTLASPRRQSGKRGKGESGRNNGHHLPTTTASQASQDYSVGSGGRERNHTVSSNIQMSHLWLADEESKGTTNPIARSGHAI